MPCTAPGDHHAVVVHSFEIFAIRRSGSSEPTDTKRQPAHLQAESYQNIFHPFVVFSFHNMFYRPPTFDRESSQAVRLAGNARRKHDTAEKTRDKPGSVSCTCSRFLQPLESTKPTLRTLRLVHSLPEAIHDEPECANASKFRPVARRL